jgi:hypothetical protein
MWGQPPSAVRRAGRIGPLSGFVSALPGDPSAILAIQKIAHRPPPGLIRFTQTLALVGVHAALICRCTRIFRAAFRAAVGKPRLARLQLKLLPADAASFDWESHTTL